MTNEQIDRGLDYIEKIYMAHPDTMHWVKITWSEIVSILKAMKDPEEPTSFCNDASRIKDPIREVYKKWKGENIEGVTNEFMNDMWQAIKEYSEEKDC